MVSRSRNVLKVETSTAIGSRLKDTFDVTVLPKARITLEGGLKNPKAMDSTFRQAPRNPIRIKDICELK